MKRNELIKLRELVTKEVERRERIKTLLENELVKEYLELSKIEPNELDSNNIKEILNQILNDFTISKTNGIYVCTAAYYTDYRICYEDTDYFIQDTKIDNKHADYRTYTNIETLKSIEASKDNNKYYKAVIEEFEENNLVLNPYNTCNNKNGLNEVRMDFFENSLTKGQAKSKQLLLKKYPIL